MKQRYKVVEQMQIKDSKVLTLDKSRSFSDYNTSRILVDNVKVPYSLTHAENLIIVNTPIEMKGKEISFIS